MSAGRIEPEERNGVEVLRAGLRRSSALTADRAVLSSWFSPLPLSEQLLTDGFSVRLPARGASMFPLISGGDRVTISPAKDYVMGDVVLFRKNSELLCHRINRSFEKDNVRFFQTKGDCSCSHDEPVASDLILGKVVNIERETVSFRRRALLLLFPCLRFTGLNIILITILRRRCRGKRGE